MIFERHTLHYPDTRTPYYVYESFAVVGSNLDNGQPQWTADIGQWTAAYPEPPIQSRVGKPTTGIQSCCNLEPQARNPQTYR